MKIEVQEFFDAPTSTLTYAVWDSATHDAVVIDPVLDYDPASSRTSDASALKLIEFLRQKNLKLHFILETHAHADHLSGSQVLKRAYPQAVLAIGARIQDVQSVFKEIFHLAPEFRTDGSQFDRLLNDGEEFRAGSLHIRTMFTPGHTPACACFVVSENVFVGDSLFMPDSGTGRCDFPLGSASELYTSIHDKLYRLPDHFNLYTGHDYQPGGRPLKFMATIAEQKKSNIHIRAETTREEYIKFRNERDRTLAAPKLLLPSVQVNIDAGHLPPPESNGKRYLKIPIQ